MTETMWLTFISRVQTLEGQLCHLNRGSYKYPELPLQ